MTTQASTKSPLSTLTLAVGIIAASLGVLSLLPLVGLIFSFYSGLILGFFAFFAGLAAVIIGHIAIAKSGNRRALLGLALGYSGLAILVGRIVFSAVIVQF